MAFTRVVPAGLRHVQNCDIAYITTQVKKSSPTLLLFFQIPLYNWKQPEKEVPKNAPRGICKKNYVQSASDVF
jgi:hypothetical protein